MEPGVPRDSKVNPLKEEEDPPSPIPVKKLKKFLTPEELENIRFRKIREVILFNLGKLPKDKLFYELDQLPKESHLITIHEVMSITFGSTYDIIRGPSLSSPEVHRLIFCFRRQYAIEQLELVEKKAKKALKKGEDPTIYEQARIAINKRLTLIFHEDTESELDATRSAYYAQYGIKLLKIQRK